MADISNIIYSKYIQATNALNDYAVKVSSNLGSGIKSKQRMRKLNLMSSWIDLLGIYIKKPKFDPGSSIPPVTISNFSADFAGESISVFVEVQSGNGGIDGSWYLGGGMTIPTVHYNFYNELYTLLLEQSKNTEGGWPPGLVVSKNAKDKSIKLEFPKNTFYNGGKIGFFGMGSAVISSSTYKGGREPSAEIIPYEDIPKKQMLEKLDIIAAELGIVYNTSEDLSETI